MIFAGPGLDEDSWAAKLDDAGMGSVVSENILTLKGLSVGQHHFLLTAMVQNLREQIVIPLSIVLQKLFKLWSRQFRVC